MHLICLEGAIPPYPPLLWAFLETSCQLSRRAMGCAFAAVLDNVNIHDVAFRKRFVLDTYEA